MVRSTLQAIIGRVRDTINDNPADATQQVFTDQQIQDVLDGHRRDVKHLMLAPLITEASGIVQWLDYYAPPFWATGQGRANNVQNVMGQRLGNWEDGHALRDMKWEIIEADTTDPLVGHWTFLPTNYPGNVGQVPPVYIDGSVYDIYASAAELCRKWAQKWAPQYGFSMGRRARFNRSEAVKNLKDMASEFDMYAWPLIIEMTRNDTEISDGLGRAF